MYRRRARLDGHRDNGVHVEIAVCGAGSPDTPGLIGDLHVIGPGVCGRKDRDGLHAHLLAGANDAHGDLATVGNEDLLKH